MKKDDRFFIKVYERVLLKNISWLHGSPMTVFLWMLTRAPRKGPEPGVFRASEREIAVGIQKSRGTAVDGIRELLRRGWVERSETGSGPTKQTLWRIIDFKGAEPDHGRSSTGSRISRNRITGDPHSAVNRITGDPVPDHGLTEPDHGLTEPDHGRSGYSNERAREDVPDDQTTRRKECGAEVKTPSADLTETVLVPPPKNKPPRKLTPRQLAAIKVAEHPDVVAVMAHINERLNPVSPYEAKDWSLKIANGIKWFSVDLLKQAIDRYAADPFWAGQGKLHQLLKDKAAIQGWINAKPRDGITPGLMPNGRKAPYAGKVHPRDQNRIFDREYTPEDLAEYDRTDRMLAETRKRQEAAKLAKATKTALASGSEEIGQAMPVGDDGGAND